jgi:hypothetical protein
MAVSGVTSRVCMREGMNSSISISKWKNSKKWGYIMLSNGKLSNGKMWLLKVNNILQGTN